MSDNIEEAYAKGVVHNALDVLRRLTNLSTASLNEINKAMDGEGALFCLPPLPEEDQDHRHEYRPVVILKYRPRQATGEEDCDGSDSRQHE